MVWGISISSVATRSSIPAGATLSDGLELTMLAMGTSTRPPITLKRAFIFLLPVRPDQASVVPFGPSAVPSQLATLAVESRRGDPPPSGRHDGRGQGGGGSRPPERKHPPTVVGGVRSVVLAVAGGSPALPVVIGHADAP